ncbi:reverse transcriptase domain-containing protein, partial [Tanacetum coccineum]
ERKANFRNHQRSERRHDKFTLLTESPKEILAIDKGKFKTPPPMTTPVGKRNNNKFYEFHRGVGHNTDECMHLRRQIEELIKGGKLSHVIKELKQGEFSVKSNCNLIDDSILPKFDVPTRWVKLAPIKVNILAWKIRLDRLPTRMNLFARGLEFPSILCPLCNKVDESSSYIFFSCSLAQ